jgi:hypothetical protein
MQIIGAAVGERQWPTEVRDDVRTRRAIEVDVDPSCEGMGTRPEVELDQRRLLGRASSVTLGKGSRSRC